MYLNIKIHHYIHNQAIAVCGFKCSLWTHSHWIHCPGFCVVLFLALNSNTRFSRTFSDLRHKKRMFAYGICHPREQISQCVWYTTRKGIFKDLGTKIFCWALKQSKKALAAWSLRVHSLRRKFGLRHWAGFLAKNKFKAAARFEVSLGGAEHSGKSKQWSGVWRSVHAILFPFLKRRPEDYVSEVQCRNSPG